MSVPALLKNPENSYAKMAAFAGSKEQVEEGLAALSYSNGLITAVVVSPKFIPTEEWMPHIIDPNSPELDADERELSKTLMLIEHGEILDSLAADDDAYEPFFWEDEDGRLFTKDWARGFFQGMQLRWDAWSTYFKTGRPENFVPLLLLLEDEKFFTNFEEAGVDLEEYCEVAREQLPLLIQEFFKRSSHARHEYRSMVAHAGKKTGRNDPCPCGSGKKYKKCCLN